MAISWTLKQQLKFFFAFLLIVLIGVAFFLYSALKPTCFDGEQNQNEQDIDCGGVCARECLGQTKDVIVLWARAVKTSKGSYDLVALVDNPNISLGAINAEYQFKAYDKDNVLVSSVKKGKTFINSGGQFIVFEPNVDVGQRIPVRAFVEFNNIEWKKVEKKDNSLYISEKTFSHIGIGSRLLVVVGNSSVVDINNIYASVVLYDKEKNIMGASSTKIDYVAGGSSKEVVFTWPEPFEEEPAFIEVFLRVNEVI